MNTNVNKAIRATLFGIIMLFPIISHAQVLPQTGGGQDGATNASDTSSLPPTGGGQDGATTAPDTSSLPPTGGSQDGATVAPTAPDAPVAPISTTIGSYGGNTLPPVSSTGTSSATTTATGSSTSTTTPSIAINSCPLINTYMQVGANNDSSDVIKLQAFLKTNENLDVDLSGIFDSKTEAGVKAFQAKYLADTMGPWKATTPTGKVYISTKRKINEIACNSVINFTPSELATINAYLQGNQNASTTVGTVGPSAPTIGENSNGANSNTASVANAPVIQKIWNFIKGIFGR